MNGGAGIAWALNREVPTAQHRLVLTVLVANADDNGVVVAPAKDIAGATLLSLRTIRYILKDLAESNVIEASHHRRADGRQGSLRIRFIDLSPFTSREEDSRVQEMHSGKAKEAHVRQTASLPPLEVEDLTTGQGLKAALSYLMAHDWSGPVAEALAVAIEGTVKTRLGWIVNRRAGRDIGESRHDVMSQMWEVMRLGGESLLAADSPWGLAVQMTAKQIARRDEREALGAEVVEEIHGQGGMDDSISVVDDVMIDDVADSSGALSVIVSHLSDRGVPEMVVWQGIQQVVKIAATCGATRRITRARDDQTLASQGWTPKAAGLLMALIAGTRRGGEEESMFYRLAQGGQGVTAAEERRLEGIRREFLQVPTGPWQSSSR